ncbi:MAG: MXAN_5187 C-terminal domain-containing protein [Candidatus Lernaella stagnicola]|nr:MXAN_5187 C-terminal domain-containing protein [Candidatus Lernaella stagnicola]
MEIEQAIAQIKKAMFDLRRDYEQFFKGDLRRPPMAERDRVQKILTKLQVMRVTNTQLKFQIQTVGNQFLTYCRLWDRIMAQIETGTYAPDRFKADQRVGRVDDISEKRSKTGEAPPRAMSNEREMRVLYNQYITARHKTGENTRLSYNAFQRSVEKQRPVIEKRLGRDAAFKVVVEDGRAKVKGS